MPTRSRTSFQKKQKELLRLEKQREKAAKRLARKNAPKETGDVEPDLEQLNDTEPESQNPSIPQAGNTVSG